MKQIIFLLPQTLITQFQQQVKLIKTILSDLGKMSTKYGKTGPKDLSSSYKEYLYGEKSKHTI